jgi:uncharacterized protein
MRQEDPSRAAGRPIVIFIVLAYALSWSIWLPMIAAGQVIRPGMLPTHFPGLLGPAAAALIAALVVGKPALGDLRHRLLHIPWTDRYFWVLTLSPIGFVVAALTIAVIIGQRIDLSGLRLYSGLPALNPVLIFLFVLIVNGFGEEIGWRGFLLPRLQLRFGPIMGTVLTTLVWGGWHAPLFFLINDYQAMTPTLIVFGFGLGLLCGAFVLAHVMARTGGSVPATATWHALYNMGTATAVGGLVPALTTTVVMIWGGGLLAWALTSEKGRTAITVLPVAPDVRV